MPEELEGLSSVVGLREVLIGSGPWLGTTLRCVEESVFQVYGPFHDRPFKIVNLCSHAN